MDPPGIFQKSDKNYPPLPMGFFRFWQIFIRIGPTDTVSVSGVLLVPA